MQAKRDQIEQVAGIQVQKTGYYVPRPNGSPRRITNFHLEPIAAYVVEGMWDRYIESHDFYVVRDGHRENRLNVHRSHWDSVESFKAAMNFVRNGLVKANADQVMDLKSFLTENPDMESIVSVHQAGIHRHVEYKDGSLARDGEVLFDTQVWVEPGWSVNAVRVRDTHTLHHKGVHFIAHLKKIQDATPADAECIEVFRKAITVNRPEVIGTMLGWVVACNLKHHIMTLGDEFPLLHIFGPSQVGKTKTAQILTALAGADLSRLAVSGQQRDHFPGERSRRLHYHDTAHNRRMHLVEVFAAWSLVCRARRVESCVPGKPNADGHLEVGR
jgi:hypothetical protein